MNLWIRGFKTLFAEDGTEALKLFHEQPIDLVLLDISMPGPNGLEVCETIRRSSDVPIVFLSGNARESDKVAALDLGGDDYLTKPFGVPELLARVNAVLRRVHTPMTERRTYRLGDLIIEVESQLASRNGEDVSFTATEFKLLALLLKNQHKVLAHRYILQSVWGGAYSDEREYLRAYVYRLRKKIERDPRRPKFILSVAGVGYRIRSDEEADEAPEDSVPAHSARRVATAARATS
jgi:two-component system KDP operon response regulator KdpE